MRMYFVPVLFACFFLNSCKKNDSSNVLPVTPKISGSVILPAGSNLNVNGLVVQSSFYSSNVAEGKYSIDTLNFNYSTQFVTDFSDNVVLMKYNYPGQPNYDISAHSTALALVMNATPVLSLNGASRLKLINDITAHADFTNFTTEIENSIKAGSNFLQPDPNSSIAIAATKLFTTVSNMRMAGPFEDPIKIERSGRTISFSANTACPYVIGIYKDNNPIRQEKLVLLGAQVYATSIKDLLYGIFGGGYGEVPQVIYTMPSDGNYQFRIRSGHPGYSTNVQEELEAYREQIQEAILDAIDGVLGIPINSECYKAIKSQAKEWVKTIRNLPASSNSLSELGEIMHDLTVQFFKSQNELFKCASIPKESVMQKYVIFVGRVVKFFDLVGKIGTTMNVSAQVISWFKTKPAIDTCLTVSGNTVTTCSPEAVTIGNQTWMKKNLNVSKYNNGDVIPQVTDMAQWRNLTTGAWCYYNNNTNNEDRFGKLYNWYAINDSRGLAPQGWHIPSQSEWTTLSNYLGGALVAGGKMKDTTAGLWWYSVHGGTNSSGFTGMPGGGRGHLWFTNGTPTGQQLDFQEIFIAGRWWSSTEGGAVIKSATLHYGVTRLDQDDFTNFGGKDMGFSVRCLKN